MRISKRQKSQQITKPQKMKKFLCLSLCSFKSTTNREQVEKTPGRGGWAHTVVEVSKNSWVSSENNLIKRLLPKETVHTYIKQNVCKTA